MMNIKTREGVGVGQKLSRRAGGEAVGWFGMGLSRKALDNKIS